VGEHVELANACAFLLSDLASYVSGDCMVVDGGKRWLSGAAQGDTAALLGFDDAWWDGLRAR
jgi:NAD(P)-dependent dehydrogenase (short-subunit alcohol dehydrogenase family)